VNITVTDVQDHQIQTHTWSIVIIKTLLND